MIHLDCTQSAFHSCSAVQSAVFVLLNDQISYILFIVHLCCISYISLLTWRSNATKFGHFTTLRHLLTNGTQHLCYYSDYTSHKGHSETISWILQHPCSPQTYSYVTTLTKDWDEPKNIQGAVCKIKCSDCQTSVLQSVRLAETLTRDIINWQTTKLTGTLPNYFQRLTLESWYINLEQMPLNRYQPLSAPYKRLIHDENEADKRTVLTDRLLN